VETKTRLDLLQIILFGILILFPLHRLFGFSYLGTVESQINKRTYDDAKKHFFFDYYNLNPIEEIEGQLKKIRNEESQQGFTVGKRIQMAEFKRNAIITDNLLLRAMYLYFLENKLFLFIFKELLLLYSF